MARGGRPIDPNAASTIELATSIDEKGQLEPVRVKSLPRVDHEGREVRLVAGYRRICAMDRLHSAGGIRTGEGPLIDYRVHVIPSNATSELEEAAENFAENFGHLPPNDWDIGEGLAALRREHKLSVDLVLTHLFTQQPGALVGRERARKCVLAWENLIEPLRQLWRKNTSLFQLTTGRPFSAIEASRKTPLEQEDILDKIVHEAEVRKEKAASGLSGGSALAGASGTGTATTVRRPTARQIHAAASWIKQHAADPHEDGLTRDQRVFARKFTRWLLSIPAPDGTAPRCPIKRRKKLALLEGDEK